MTSRPDPPALSEHYHKARRQLILWSAILASWELIGVDLEQLVAVGGNIGAAVSSLRNPRAVPWILAIAVIYFSFRTGVEWYQCNGERRTRLISRIDYNITLSIAFASLALYTVQLYPDRYMAEYVINFVFIAFLGGLGIPIMSYVIYIDWKGKFHFADFYVFWVASGFFSFMALNERSYIPFGLWLLGFFFGIFLAVKVKNWVREQEFQYPR